MTRPDAVAAIAALLASDVGYSIDLFGLLAVMQLEDGRFAVFTFRYDPSTGRSELEAERLFDDPRAAAEAFEAERAIRRLGYEHERDPAATDGS